MRRRLALRTLGLLFTSALLLTQACGEEPSPGDETIQPVAPEEAHMPDESDEEEVTAYSIHEWGLIDVDLGDSRAEYAAGPGQAEAEAAPAEPEANGTGGGGVRPTGQRPTGQRPNVVNNAVGTANDLFDTLTGGGNQRPQPNRPNRPQRRKPVLYFHLHDTNADFNFDITIDLGSAARMLEHYPAGTLEGHQVRWSNVQLSRESCSGGPYPGAESELCQNVPDDYCEAAELAAYESDDAGCLTVAGSQQNFLFYRGDGPAPELPLTIERGADGTITVTNTTLAEPVGELLRLRRSGDSIRVAHIAIPAAGSSISVGLPATDANESHRELIRAQLRSIGLTAGEAGAFERAWFGELFDGEAGTPHAFPDAVLFFLPQSQIDGFAHIDADPSPAETVRAMAIRAGWTTL